MLRLTLKNYMLHLSYSIVLILQMVIVLFAVSNTLIQVINDNKILDNVIFEEEFYFVERNETDEKQFVEEVEKIVGENCVGYMYHNGTIGMDGLDEIETPPLEYLNPKMEKIQYTLKEGHWFSGKENEVVLGGKVSENYHAGDEILLEKNDTQKKANIIGILKEPAKVIHLEGSDGENLFDCMNKRKSVMLTNSKELLAWTGEGSRLEASLLVVDVTGKKSCLENLQEKYIVTSLEQAKNNGKKQIIKDTVGNLLYMCILVGIALLSVSMQIYIYLRRNKEEYRVYRMLGMSRSGIFGIWCTQHIVNLGIVMIILYLIAYLTEDIGRSSGTTGISLAHVVFHGVYCLLYILITVVVYKMTIKSIEKL